MIVEVEGQTFSLIEMENGDYSVMTCEKRGEGEVFLTYNEGIPESWGPFVNGAKVHSNLFHLLKWMKEVA